MSTFGGLMFTNKGRNLQAKAQTGVQLQFTKIALGDGSLGGSAIADLTNLKNTVVTLPIERLRTLSGGRAEVAGILSNQSLASGFYYRELGLFATDPQEGEILFCYGNAGNLAEYIPASGGADVIEKQIVIQTIVGNATNVTAVIDTSLVYATVTDMNLAIQQNLLDSKKYTNTEFVLNIGYGVQAGLETTSSAIPDMFVHVQSGIVYMQNGERFEFNAVTDIAVTAADVTNPRKDIIYVSSVGKITYLAGTPSTTPVNPVLPEGAFELAKIDVPAGDTAIEGTQLIDARVFKDNLPKLRQEVTTHLAENTYQLINISRDLSLIGIQIIPTEFKVKKITAIAQVDTSPYKTSDGFWVNSGAGVCRRNTGKTAYGPGSFVTSNSLIYITDSDVNVTLANVESIQDNSIRLNWDRFGTGATGTVNLILVVESHF